MYGFGAPLPKTGTACGLVSSVVSYLSAWLLQATGVGDAMHPLGFAHAGGGPLPEVDLSDELAIMQASRHAVEE